MTEKEFTASLENSVVIQQDKYEKFVVNSVILDKIRQVVKRSTESFGLSREDTKTLEVLLGIERGGKE